MRGFTSSDQAQVVEFLATKLPRDLRDEALDDLRNQLAETRAERDRYVERVKLLEARLESMREVLAGGWDWVAWD